ncbi:archease [Halostella sp. JP-L12]|uniref:archease n=1 Tax=Halostella TaxID=1843185 RepID=UPI000EF77064|nr:MULTISPECIES: archease [Halostella]NHN48627.1 archease [Halostella sp. JP-L12]
MPYELRDHTADVAVAATGATLGDVFAAVADGLAAAMCDEVPASGERFDVTVAAESREALLFDYLDDLIYQRDVRGVLPVDHEATVERADGAGGEAGETLNGDGENATEWTLSGSARGVPLSEIYAREIKAVTYSEMDLSRTDDGWRAYVVFDV